MTRGILLLFAVSMKDTGRACRQMVSESLESVSCPTVPGLQRSDGPLTPLCHSTTVRRSEANGHRDHDKVRDRVISILRRSGSQAPTRSSTLATGSPAGKVPNGMPGVRVTRVARNASATDPGASRTMREA